jgi:hypothetical protein
MARLWPKGKAIAIRFLDPPTTPGIAPLRARVEGLARTWTDHTNLSFHFLADTDPTPAEVSVRLAPYLDRRAGLSRSYIGREALDHVRRVATMDLIFAPSATDEFRRFLVLHEFGHVLGLIHEHQRPGRVFDWSPAIYDLARSAWRWERDQIDAQLQALYAAPERVAGTRPDPKSVMMYPIRAGWAHYRDDHSPFVVPINSNLSPGDKIASNSVYGFPARFKGLGSLRVDDEKWSEARLDDPGEVLRFEVCPKAGQTLRSGRRLTLEVRGPTPVLAAWLRERPTDDNFNMNILNAAETETGADRLTISLVLAPPRGARGDDAGTFFVEIRHLTPRTGTGPLTLRVYDSTS